MSIYIFYIWNYGYPILFWSHSSFIYFYSVTFLLFSASIFSCNISIIHINRIYPLPKSTKLVYLWPDYNFEDMLNFPEVHCPYVTTVTVRVTLLLFLFWLWQFVSIFTDCQSTKKPFCTGYPPRSCGIVHFCIYIIQTYILNCSWLVWSDVTDRNPDRSELTT